MSKDKETKKQSEAVPETNPSEQNASSDLNIRPVSSAPEEKEESVTKGNPGGDLSPDGTDASVNPLSDAAENPPEEMGMAELLAQEESAAGSTASAENSFLMAKVISIIEDGALVDIGEKSEALIPRDEFDKSAPFSIGETVPVMLHSKARENGYLKVSWQAARERMAWEHVEQAFKRKLPIQAKVKSETRGGLLIECEGGLVGFIPASQVDIRPARDLKRWKGQAVSVYVMEYDPGKNNLVCSRKLWISEENQKKKSETLAGLKPEDIKKGVVTGVTSFGAFVDIGGIEGLLHIGELEWAHTNKVSDILKVGQEIEVKVIKFDPETEKLSLSRKALLPHPWEKIEERFPVGTITEGKVVSLTDFGAFVEIAPQVEGLLHASEISWESFSQKPQERLKAGQTIQVKIIHVDRKQGKISLSLKRTQASPWGALQENHPVGSAVKVAVSYLVPFGAFARMPNGIEGLIHISDFSWTKRVRHPEDVLKIGEELEVKVLEIDSENEKISFGIKQLKPNPYETYAKGNRLTVTITQVTEAGAVAEIEPGLEGFLPRSEISNEQREKIEQPGSLLSVGDKVDAQVIAVDPKERKISLSIKKLEMELQRAAAKKYSAKTPRPKLGELLDS